jgi:hypothetical protein
MLGTGPGGGQLCFSLFPCSTSKFYESVSPLSRWVLLTRILFVTCYGLGQQTQGQSVQGEF